MLKTVHIYTQRYENYGYDEGREYWKPKGEHVFEVEIDFDWLMYVDEETRTAVFNALLAKQSNELEMFEYRDMGFKPYVTEISFGEVMMTINEVTAQK